jgi:hypothetical protein
MSNFYDELWTMVPTTNSSEIECLGALWQAEAQGLAGLKPSQIRQIVNKRRLREKRKPVAVSTISTVMRTAAAKGLVIELRVDAEGRPLRGRKRGHAAKLKVRSPNTAYRAGYDPKQILRQFMKPIIKACPDVSRAALLSDLTKALKRTRRE